MFSTTLQAGLGVVSRDSDGNIVEVYSFMLLWSLYLWFYGCSCIIPRRVHYEFPHESESYTFASVRGQILLMEPFPSLNNVFSPVTQEER